MDIIFENNNTKHGAMDIIFKNNNTKHGSMDIIFKITTQNSMKQTFFSKTMDLLNLVLQWYISKTHKTVKTPKNKENKYFEGDKIEEMLSKLEVQVNK